MTRTRRYYNHPNHIKDFYHPYLVLCCGHCPNCKDWSRTRRAKLRAREEIRRQIEMESP